MSGQWFFRRDGDAAPMTSLFRLTLFRVSIVPNSLIDIGQSISQRTQTHNATGNGRQGFYWPQSRGLHETIAGDEYLEFRQLPRSNARIFLSSTFPHVLRQGPAMCNVRSEVFASPQLSRGLRLGSMQCKNGCNPLLHTQWIEMSP